MPARPTAVAAKPVTADQSLAVGRRIYQARCAACHGSAQPGTPSRVDLARMPPARIVDALVRGVMKPMAGGMSQNDVNSVAKFLTTKP